MNNVFIFRCKPAFTGPNIIGHEIDKPYGRKARWDNSVWIEKARVMVPMPSQQQAMVEIRYFLVGDTPIGIGVEEVDGIAEFPLEMFWHLSVRPKPRILSDYMKATSGLELPFGAEIPKEMRQ